MYNLNQVKKIGYFILRWWIRNWFSVQKAFISKFKQTYGWQYVNNRKLRFIFTQKIKYEKEVKIPTMISAQNINSVQL